MVYVCLIYTISISISSGKFFLFNECLIISHSFFLFIAFITFRHDTKYVAKQHSQSFFFFILLRLSTLYVHEGLELRHSINIFKIMIHESSCKPLNLCRDKTYSHRYHTILQNNTATKPRRWNHLYFLVALCVTHFFFLFLSRRHFTLHACCSYLLNIENAKYYRLETEDFKLNLNDILAFLIKYF